MTSQDLSTLAAIWQQVALLNAASTRVEGMVALNTYRVNRDETIAYDDGSFEEAAENMDRIASTLQGLGVNA